MDRKNTTMSIKWLISEKVVRKECYSYSNLLLLAKKN
ncbi:hypothetical protein EUBDOL_01637 [Amedibacillus dolichus DSM 3991]|uniref:Uncharacterized protein n=1 Tax=Amedibacillus dolichus DSM 3991 TaxID=428127 RepID=A8RDZ1_9FIRM|nr:hypothetical protein EUBDOL_01637 [Amedibacillus dolichus DSM 3991]